jgi:hypothetical protein
MDSIDINSGVGSVQDDLITEQEFARGFIRALKESTAILSGKKRGIPAREAMARLRMEAEEIKII